jgi:lysine decarboxylase
MSVSEPGTGRRRREGAAPPQSQTPYLDALRAYADREPGRFHVPGHKGGAAADPGLVDAIGMPPLALDIPALTPGIDQGPEPTPFQQAQALAAEAWGARRSWFMVNGASQGNHVALLTLAHMGSEVVVQRNAHSSTVDALVVSGLRPAFVAPELDPDLGIAHCIDPDALDRALAGTPAAAGATVVSPTYFGAVADIATLAEVAHARGVPLVVDESWGAHLTFHPDLPAPALALGADLVISSTHKVVGSVTQSAIVHLGHGDRFDEEVVDRCVTLLDSTSPSSLLSGSLDAARRLAVTSGEALLERTLAGLATVRTAIRALPGVDVLDDGICGAPGVFAYDPLRLVIDVRGTSATGYELARLMREQSDVFMELAGENVLVGVFGMAEDAAVSGERLVAALARALDSLPAPASGDEHVPFAAPPPWGDLVMTPRAAFFGPQEVVPAREAVGRVAAESMAAYPPGIPNVLPGERLTAETLAYVQDALDHGGSLRGASDRLLRTVRVVIEDPGRLG